MSCMPLPTTKMPQSMRLFLFFETGVLFRRKALTLLTSRSYLGPEKYLPACAVRLLRPHMRPPQKQHTQHPQPLVRGKPSEAPRDGINGVASSHLRRAGFGSRGMDTLSNVSMRQSGEVFLVSSPSERTSESRTIKSFS